PKLLPYTTPFRSLDLVRRDLPGGRGGRTGILREGRQRANARGGGPAGGHPAVAEPVRPVAERTGRTRPDVRPFPLQRDQAPPTGGAGPDGAARRDLAGGRHRGRSGGTHVQDEPLRHRGAAFRPEPRGG